MASVDFNLMGHIGKLKDHRCGGGRETHMPTTTQITPAAGKWQGAGGRGQGANSISKHGFDPAIQIRMHAGEQKAKSRSKRSGDPAILKECIRESIGREQGAGKLKKSKRQNALLEEFTN